MLNKITKGKRTARSIYVFFLVFIFSVSSLSCEPLRKKFTRKKKEDKKSEIIPILEPIDYEAREEHAKERYTYYYLVWKSWQKELYDETKTNDGKRMRNMFEQMVKQLNEMKNWLTEEKKAELENEIQKTLLLKKEIYAPDSMRNRFIVEKELRLHEKRIRNSFSPSKGLQFVEKSI